MKEVVHRRKFALVTVFPFCGLFSVNNFCNLLDGKYNSSFFLSVQPLAQIIDGSSNFSSRDILYCLYPIVVNLMCRPVARPFQNKAANDGFAVKVLHSSALT